MMSREIGSSKQKSIDQDPRQWQPESSKVGPSGSGTGSAGIEQVAFASESNNFTLGREILTASHGHPGTSSADSNHRRISQGGMTSQATTNEANDTLRGNNLPSML